LGLGSSPPYAKAGSTVGRPCPQGQAIWGVKSCFIPMGSQKKDIIKILLSSAKFFMEFVWPGKRKSCPRYLIT
ncbi:MAG: hypothetical protein ACLFQG_08255, partial [Desulfovermiculus sp.]